MDDGSAVSALLLFDLSFNRCPPALDLRQSMAGAGIKVEFIKLLEVSNALQRGRVEGCFAVEGMKHNAFEYVAQRHVVILGECFKHFENPLLDANTGLNPLNFEPRFVR